MIVWNQLEPLLGKVQKPARYIGCEEGAQTPDHTPEAAAWLLAYPDTYEIGLPNQGLQILYEIINERPDGVAERTYAPWTDMEEQLRANDVPLFSVDSHRAAADFCDFVVLGDGEEAVGEITAVVHDRLNVEVFRGCTRGCRFCQAGMITRPVRERPADQVRTMVADGLKRTGYDEVALTSLSTADFSGIDQVVRDTVDDPSCGGQISVSLPSLRVDAFTVGIAGEIQKARRTGLTFAPEAGSWRMRQVINKLITEEDLYAAVRSAYSHDPEATMAEGLVSRGDRRLGAVWERTIRRVGLPVSYSQGFSPHPKLHFGLALSTGHESLAEFLDIDLDGSSPAVASGAEVIGLPARLSAVLPVGLEVTAVGVIADNATSLQQAVESSEWRVEIRDVQPAQVADAIHRALAATELVVTRQRKGKDVTDDVRPYLLDLVVVGTTDNGTDIHAHLATQPRGLRISELLAVLGTDWPEGRVRRLTQWTLLDGARSEPLEGPPGATSAPHAQARAS